MTRIKVCGVTLPDDARQAALLGADAVGLNFSPQSPRFVTPEQAARIIDSLPLFVAAVGVFVNYPDPQALEDFAMSVGLDVVQLHGDESPEYCSMITRVKVMKALRVRPGFRVQSLAHYHVSGFLLDAYSSEAYGGTGTTFEWHDAAGANAFGDIIIAGGLNPENVGEAIFELHPFGVDVSSGVESSPGEKDYHLMQQFVDAVRRADAE